MWINRKNQYLHTPLACFLKIKFQFKTPKDTLRTFTLYKNIFQLNVSWLLKLFQFRISKEKYKYYTNGFVESAFTHLYLPIHKITSFPFS